MGRGEPKSENLDEANRSFLISMIRTEILNRLSVLCHLVAPLKLHHQKCPKDNNYFVF